MPAKDAIALLKADHRKVEELFEKYENARGRKAEIAPTPTASWPMYR